MVHRCIAILNTEKIDYFTGNMVINKHVLLQIFLIGILLTACKKEGNNSNNNGFKINIVKGDNQTDTAGRPLKDTLEFRASDNNDTLLSGYVEYIHL